MFLRMGMIFCALALSSSDPPLETTRRDVALRPNSPRVRPAKQKVGAGTELVDLQGSVRVP